MTKGGIYKGHPIPEPCSFASLGAKQKAPEKSIIDLLLQYEERAEEEEMRREI